jgi:CheY-like chemotaxis protein/anti-sigma regulatory factor (Ser/Thr protein kinase)
MTAIAERNIDDKRSVEDCLKKINTSGNHLLTLINDILDMSKIESGKYALSPIVFSIADLVDNLINIVRQDIKAKSLMMRIHTHGIDYEYLYADQLRLNQIYINILSNAVKYTNAEGRIMVDLFEMPIPDKNDYVRLVYRVEDTGIGMTPEFMERMYDSFAREKDGRTDNVQGSGLGLAIVKQLVDLMGGNIEAESKVGSGTIFIVTLDIKKAENEPTYKKLRNIPTLVIEPDKITMNNAKHILEQIGITADITQLAQDGIDLIKARREHQNDYELIMLGWDQPNGNALDIIKQIREMTADKPPVIVVCARDVSEIENEATAVGASGFLSKPLFKSNIYDKLCSLFCIETDDVVVHKEDVSINGLNILIAEDNDINYEIAAGLLEYEGATCKRAVNGKACLQMVERDKKHSYDLVLMDVQMPVMKGIEATKRIRVLPDEQAKNIPIIAMTADAFADNIAECLDAGMDGHIAKPINMPVAIKEIKRVMQNHSSVSTH